MAMIMQNEEIHIPVAIAQFYHIVNDIVVVDGGSNDKSVSWAEKMGARVFHRPFENDFSAQKNFAIDQLETDWVYFNDPDERLDPPLLEALPLMITVDGQQLLMSNGILPTTHEYLDCFGIPRKNFIDGIQTQVYPDYQYRLFRRYCCFEGAVHEKIVNFQERTELDYLRPEAARPDVKAARGAGTVTTERGLIEEGIDVFDPNNIARFNILHYKSSLKQIEQDTLYRKIRGD